MTHTKTITFAFTDDEGRSWQLETLPDLPAAAADALVAALPLGSETWSGTHIVEVVDNSVPPVQPSLEPDGSAF